ncbi:MAG: squalene synthase HpnC [Planctomycetes bacterium]|jgi:squalene synthase HpnC|nr:squalene synthase HpnC [Planctomycetota bacterium]
MSSLVLDQLERFGPDRCEQLSPDEASDYTRRLTEAQYENFTVVSKLLPRRLRDDFRHVYAFCRWADDLGDEADNPDQATRLLAWWRRELDLCYDAQPRHPVFVALRGTIEKRGLPRQPFDDLIDAFLQDQSVTRYDSWDQLLDYCTRSANPVGRLVLYLVGVRDAESQRLSDATCTALQLTNFWQDVRRDILERDRVYLPADVAGKHRLSRGLLVEAVKTDAAVVDECGCVDVPTAGVSALLPSFRATLRELVGRTRPMFDEGRKLWPRVPRDVRIDIKLFTLGGEAVLKMIERRGYDTLTARPSLGRGAKAGLLLRAVAGKLLPFG